MIAENVTDDELEDARMLNVTDLSNCLRISVRQCWRLSKKKLLPAPVCFGERIIRWNGSDVAAWLRAGSPPRAQWIWQSEQKSEAARTAQ